MARFTCSMINEMVILSDGRVTTCCHDALGRNSYSSISSDSFDQVAAKFLLTRQRLVEDFLSLPQCADCFHYFSQSGNPGMNFDPSDDEIEAFLGKEGEARQYTLVIEPTVKCNLRCMGCPTNKMNLSDYRSAPFIDFERLKIWLTGTAAKVSKIRFYNYGETFLHPHSIDFLEFVHEHLGDVDIDIATNGLPLSTRAQRIRLVKSNVGTIHFSIHGSNQENIEKYMSDRYSFQNIIKILRDIVEIKREMKSSKPWLIWKYILFEWNDSDDAIMEAKSVAKTVGVDKVYFELAAHPAPSKRFGDGNEEWRKFTAGMEITAYNGGRGAFWDSRSPDWHAIPTNPDVLNFSGTAHKENSFRSRIRQLFYFFQRRSRNDNT
ncbi:MAG: radical SAM protein [Thermodesulfovibrionales bacterium]